MWPQQIIFLKASSVDHVTSFNFSRLETFPDTSTAILNKLDSQAM